MIDHKRKFIFIHIPKTGGTSIERALGLTGPQHLPLKFHTHKHYFKFTIVRNIYDKMVSWYFFHKSAKKTKLTEYHTESFREWVKSGCEIHADIPFGGEKKRMRGKSPLSDLDFLEGKDGNVNLDFIGKFENLQEDFNTVCDKIRIQRKRLPHRKKSEHNHYTEYYDEESKQIVAEKYARDIEYFGYEFGE